MKDNGSSFTFDAFGVHPYHTRLAPEVSDSWIENTTWTQQAATVNELFSEYGVTGKQNWATEVGYTSTGGQETKKASWLLRTIILNRIYGYHDKMFLFNLTDNGLDTDDDEHNYGMLLNWENTKWNKVTANAAKEQYLVTAQWNKLMAGAEFKNYTVEEREEKSAFGYVYQTAMEQYTASFENNGDKIKVVWDVHNNGEEVTLTEENTTAITVYDMYGNVLNRSYGADSVTVEAGENPVYAVFSDDIMYVLKNDSIIENTENLESGQTVTVNADLDGGSEKLFICASYNGNKLENVKFLKLDSDGRADMALALDAGRKYMLMLWDDFENMTPLAEPLIISTKGEN